MVKETKQTGLRVPLDLYAQIADAAKRDNRSINAQLLSYVKRAFEATEKNEPKFDGRGGNG